MASNNNSNTETPQSRSTQILDKAKSKAIKLNTSFIGENSRNIRGLTREFLRYGGVVQNLTSSFDKADKVQMQALATGTTLAKFTHANTKVLKDLRGDFFENAKELLKNFSAGLRGSSEGLDTLTNRMALTGQSTDSMRETMASLLSVSRNNIESVDTLSKKTVGLANQYSVSEGKLLEAVKSVGNLLTQTSLVDGSEQTAKLAAMLKAAAPAASDDQIGKTLSLLISPDFFPQRIALGMQGTADLLTSQDVTMSELLAIIHKLKANSDNIIGTSVETNDLLNKTRRLQGIGNSDSIIAARNLDGLLSNQVTVAESMRANLSEFGDTQKTQAAEASNFYKRALTEFYPDMLDALNSINRVALMAGAAGPLGALGGLLGGAGGKLGSILGFLKFLPVLGSVAALGVGAYSYFSSGKDDTPPPKKPKPEDNYIAAGNQNGLLKNRVAVSEPGKANLAEFNAYRYFASGKGYGHSPKNLKLEGDNSVARNLDRLVRNQASVNESIKTSMSEFGDYSYFASNKDDASSFKEPKAEGAYPYSPSRKDDGSSTKKPKSEGDEGDALNKSRSKSSFSYFNLAEMMTSTIRDSMNANMKRDAEIIRIQKDMLRVQRDMNSKTVKQSQALPSSSIKSER